MTTRLFILSLAFILSFASAGSASAAPEKIAPVEVRGGNGGRVWVYIPQNTPPNARLACVVVPPAGSRLFHGMSLDAGDSVEHVPYVKAGFAVVSFDISGPWPEGGKPAAIQAALKDFAKSKCGVVDATEALQLALAKYPQIDPKRLYVAGHSSAATLALQIAASSPQFQGCIAYAPITDLEARIGATVLKTLDGAAPGIAKLLHDMSPSNQVDALRCPIFLFHADDDDNVPNASVLAFRDALYAHQKPITYLSVETGGHYNSMIRDGIPKAIAWLATIDQSQKK